MKYNFTKLFLKFNYYFKLFILLLIVSTFIYIVLQKFNLLHNNIYEGFNTSLMGKIFGNCIYNNIFHNIQLEISHNKPFVDIILPREMKLTAFSIHTINYENFQNNTSTTTSTTTTQPVIDTTSITSTTQPVIDTTSTTTSTTQPVINTTSTTTSTTTTTTTTQPVIDTTSTTTSTTQPVIDMSTITSTTQPLESINKLQDKILNNINNSKTDDLTNKISINDIKYSISIGNNNLNMKFIENEYGYNKFEFNKLVNNISIFENEDNLPKYVGKKIRIHLKDYENVKDKSELMSLLDVKIYGLDVYAFTYNEYINYKSEDYKYNNENNNIDLMENKKILAIKVNTYNMDTTKLIKLKYSNSFDGNKRKMVINGPRQEGFDISTSDIIYLSRPIIAERIYIDNDIFNDDVIDNKITVWFSKVSKRDEINFKIKMDLIKNEGFDTNGENCPNASEMLQKQLQAQQICEALEYKDRTKNAMVLYEKEKEYLKKLSQQEKELKALEVLITKLIKKKNDRINNNEYYNINSLNNELRQIEKSRKEAEKALLDAKKNKNLNFELKLDPQFNNIIQKYNDLGIL